MLTRESMQPAASAMRHAVRSPLAALLAALAACSPGGPPRPAVAPTGRTVVAGVEEAEGGRAEHVIWVANNSTVPVTVYSVTLRGCRNVRGECDRPQRLAVRVPPGRRRELRRVVPADPNATFRFSYTFGWTAEARGGGRGAGAPAGTGVGAVPYVPLDSVPRAPAAQPADPSSPDPELDPAAVATLAADVAGIRVEPDSIVLSVGGVASIYEVRLLLLGPGGERLGRVRDFQWRLYPGPVTFHRPDSLVARVPGSAIAEFVLPAGALPGRAEPVAPARLTIVVTP